MLDLLRVMEKPPSPLKHSIVTLTRRSSVQPDDDNLAASWKSVLDSLKRGHGAIIWDDSPKHIKLVSQWEPAKRGQGGIRIEVCETGPDFEPLS